MSISPAKLMVVLGNLDGLTTTSRYSLLESLHRKRVATFSYIQLQYYIFYRGFLW